MTEKLTLLDSSWIQELRCEVRRLLPTWERRYPGRGPCWPVARVIADAGHGVVNYCLTSAAGRENWWGHFVVISYSGEVLDAAGEFAENPATVKPDYKDLREENEPVHHAYNQEQLDFWDRNLRRFL